MDATPSLNLDVTSTLIVDTPRLPAPPRFVDDAGRTRGGALVGTSNGGIPPIFIHLQAGADVSDGYLTVLANFANLTVSNDGSYVQRGTGSLLIDAAQGLATFRNEAGATYEIRNGLPIALGSNARLGGWPALFVNAAGATFSKTAGSITAVNLPFNNEGTVSVSSGTLQLTVGGQHTGATFETTGPTSAVTFGGANGFAGSSALGAGTFFLAPTAALQIDGSLAIGNQGAAQVLAPELGTTINNTNIMVIRSGSSLQGQADITNTGAIQVQVGASLQAGGIVQTAGTLQVNGTLSNAIGHILQLQGGVLQGSGLINGETFIGGGPTTARFRPGNSPGHFTIVGGLTMGTNSELELEVERLSDGTLAWDTVSASAMSFQAGSLVHFVIGAGVAAAGVQTLSFLDCGAGCSFDPSVGFAVDGAPGSTFSFGPNGLSLSIAPAQAVPEPARAVMMLVGAAVLLLRRNRALSH
jgi:hypothetical protein